MIFGDISSLLLLSSMSHSCSSLLFYSLTLRSEVRINFRNPLCCWNLDENSNRKLRRDTEGHTTREPALIKKNMGDLIFHLKYFLLDPLILCFSCWANIYCCLDLLNKSNCRSVVENFKDSKPSERRNSPSSQSEIGVSLSGDNAPLWGKFLHFPSPLRNLQAQLKISSHSLSSTESSSNLLNVSSGEMSSSCSALPPKEVYQMYICIYQNPA